MKERKIVKLRVDMYDDIKFKIIDTKPERDLIHYVWTRLLTLAGKVNVEGYLYMSKNLKYTIETLAIEFNRDIEQIKLALDVFIELEMIELSDDNVYRVKNFAKHQNIKVIEKIESKDETEIVKIDNNGNLEVTSSNMNKIDNISEGKTNNKLQDNGLILLEIEKNKKKKEEIFNMNKEKPLGKGETLIASWVF